MDEMEWGPVSGDDLVGEVITLYPETEDWFLSLGMHCLTCPSAQLESIREACFVHRLNTARVVRALNRLITGEEETL